MKLRQLASLLFLFVLSEGSHVWSQTLAQSTSTTGVPSWFSRCSGENGYCAVTGPTQVIFGSSTGNAPTPGGTFVTQTVRSTVLCSDATFGDPAPGATKACWSGPVPGLTPGKVLSTGGSDYPFYVQNYTNWDNNQRTVVGQYDMAPGMVAAQLKQMYKEGQRNVSLVIWYLAYAPGQWPINEVLYGAFLDSTTGQLVPQAQQNLIAVLGLIKQIGFSQVTLRLAPVGQASPAHWGNTWNEAVFQQDEAFEFSTRQTAESVLAGSSVTRVYDLGVEMGGIPHNLNSDGVTYSDGQSRTWTTRLWGDYVRQFGKADSYGFSIAYSFGTLAATIAEYDAAGTRPNNYAIDTYEMQTSIVDDLWFSYEELVGAGEEAKPLILQEVSYNDANQSQALQTELQHVPLTIAYIDQWPVSVSVNDADASPPTDYGSYGGSTATTGTLVVTPCSLSTGQSTCTTKASWATSNASNVSLYVNGVRALNASNIATTLTGTTTVTLGLAATNFQLVAGGSTLATGTGSTSGTTVLDSQAVSATDPNAPVVTLAGLGGASNGSIWAIGSNISAGCSVQLYDPNAPSSGPLATLSNPNCASKSISFAIPPAVLINYNAVSLTITNPGSSPSVAYTVGLK